MMNITEEEGCRIIINYLTVEEIFSLLDTVTKKQIKSNTKEEAIDAIISYTDTAEQFLQRQKIKREILLQYLQTEKVYPSATSNKKTLIGTVLRTWGKKDSEMLNMDEEDEDDEEDNLPLQSFVNKKSKSGSMSANASTTKITDNNAAHQSETAIVANRARPQSESQNHPGVTDTNQDGQAGEENWSRLSPLPPQINIHVHINQFTHQPTGTSPGYPPAQPQSGDGTNQTIQTMSSDVQALGEKFTKWFYDNLNSFNPMVQLDLQDFGPQHFWDDVHLELEFYSPSVHTETVVGPVLVSQRLLSFPKDDNILFNPNITKEGVFVKSNPHGLVKILACGSVHRGNACLGIFQQAFGIIRDPRFDNNWKIKYIRLQMRTGEVNSLPKLEGDVESQVQALVPL